MPSPPPPLSTHLILLTPPPPYTSTHLLLLLLPCHLLRLLTLDVCEAGEVHGPSAQVGPGREGQRLLLLLLLELLLEVLLALGGSKHGFGHAPGGERKGRGGPLARLLLLLLLQRRLLAALIS